MSRIRRWSRHGIVVKPRRLFILWKMRIKWIVHFILLWLLNKLSVVVLWCLHYFRRGNLHRIYSRQSIRVCHTWLKFISPRPKTRGLAFTHSLTSIRCSDIVYHKAMFQATLVVGQHCVYRSLIKRMSAFWWKNTWSLPKSNYNIMKEKASVRRNQ